MTVVALAGSRRALWPQVIAELTSLGFAIVALKVLPKLSSELAAALWLPEAASGAVCLVSKVGGTAELQALQPSSSSSSSGKRTSPRTAPLISALSGEHSVEVLSSLLAEQPRKCTLSRDPRTAYGQAIKCFSLADLGNVGLATAAATAGKPPPDAWRRGDAAYFFGTNANENLSTSLVSVEPSGQRPSTLELTRRAFTRLFPRGAEVTTAGVEISAAGSHARQVPRQLRQLHRAGFSFERLQMVATSPDKQDVPRLVGLLRRETAEQTLPATIDAQRLGAAMVPLNPAAVEAILPVGGPAAQGGGEDNDKQLVRPASSLKETLCVVRRLASPRLALPCVACPLPIILLARCGSAASRRTMMPQQHQT